MLIVVIVIFTIIISITRVAHMECEQEDLSSSPGGQESFQEGWDVRNRSPEDSDRITRKWH